MKIVIAVAGSSGHLSGVTRHAANLARCLLSRSGVTAIHVIAAECQWDALDSALPHNDARLHLHEISELPGESTRQATGRGARAGWL